MQQVIICLWKPGGGPVLTSALKQTELVTCLHAFLDMDRLGSLAIVSCMAMLALRHVLLEATLDHLQSATSMRSAMLCESNHNDFFMHCLLWKAQLVVSNGARIMCCFKMHLHIKCR